MPEADELPDHLMNAMDPRLLDLVRTRLTSFVQWDLVRFFNEHPQITDTAENIARYTGRDLRVVELELMKLARQNIVEAEMLTGLRVYTLSDDPAVRRLIADFIEACRDPRFCIRATYHVIANLH